MKLHRFYVRDQELTHDFWFQHKELFHQWVHVLRFEPGREVVIFNDQKEERLYRIIKIGNDAVHLELVTELEPTLPKREFYLCFALLKKDKNEWVLQKGTELGVRHFMPLLTERTEKTGFDRERAEKIVVEAAEQCGRSDIPRVRDPLTVETALHELDGKAAIYVAEQGSPEKLEDEASVAILIGPEGGWTEKEKQLFAEKNLKHLRLSELTLRAETAAISAAALLQ